jgi:hypothetical protein
MGREQINTIKKTKKGEKEIDLKPDIKVVSLEETEGNTILVLRLPAGTEKNLSPSLVTDLFVPECDSTEILSVERVAILDENQKEFVEQPIGD